MKHHLLKSVILSLILVMGVSNAWAKRYYFEVPDMDEWKGENALYAVRLCKGAGINTGTGWERLTQWDENTYYMDFKSNTYTHFQFCRMKDNITSLEGSSWMNLVHTSCYTMPSPIQTNEDEPNLLVVGEPETYDNSYQSQPYSSNWDYQTFTAQDVHILFHNNPKWNNPQLLIGTKSGYNIYDLSLIADTKNFFNTSLYHFHINQKIDFIGYTIIDGSEETDGLFEGSFLEKAAQYTQNTRRTNIYHEPLVGNILHILKGETNTKHAINIDDLNTTLNVRCEVSYDGGNTYVSTGALPVDIIVDTKYFGESWDSMDQTGKIELKKGSNVFQANTKLGFEYYCNLIANNFNNELYELVGWNNLGGNFTAIEERGYRMNAFGQTTDFVFRLKRIEPNKPCTVRFEHPNDNVTTQEVAPNTRVQEPTVEATNPGHICKWYSDGSQQNEFDFDTHIIEDITLYGAWVPEAEEGDYRLLYVEQVVEKSTQKEGDEWKTVITRKKAHPSDIIKPSDLTDGEEIVSLHVYNKNTYQAIKNPKATNNEDKYYTSPSNSEVILQRYNGTTWEDKEHHMVFGPMETLPAMAMLPGRRNAEGNAMLKYDEGIPVIQNDTKYNGNGVWNFPIIQAGNGDATLDREHIERYTGKYYIRTANAEGGWNNYTIPANHMTFSEYQASLGLGNEEFTHYFCKWVDLDKLDSKFVHYVVANDYAQAVSDTLIADRTDLFGKPLETNQQIVGNDAVLPISANIRFSWREENNALHRAYLAPSVSDRFLVLEANDSQVGIFDPTSGKDLEISGLEANEQIFMDDSKWIYHADVQMQPGADIQVTAKYNDITQYFIGDQDKFRNTVLQGRGTEKYLVRLLYDFKNNEIISAYVPGASKDVDQISTNLMIIRQNYGEAKQLVFNNGDMSTRENRRAYGVIEFTEDYLKDERIPYLKRCLYWVSFPFDVNLSEAFGSLVYGKHWLIQEYDGARRAAEGLWKESESFWKLHWEPNITLEAGLGYVIEIDINQMIKDNIIDTKDAKQQIAALYFPSNTPITREIINQASYTVNIPAHKCEIVHTGTYGDRTIRDSHWNVIGVPSYVNTGATFSDQTYALNEVVKYYYQWDGEVDKYTAMEATNPAYNFHSMYAYMVQYAGDITWNSVLLDEKPAQIAAKKNSTTNEHAMRLELQQNNILLDKTFMRLQDDVATPAFDFNYDLCKITNKGANIYSIITEEASPVEVAANVLPIKETIIPIGIKLDAAGEYTFAMPDGTDGIVVELIDYQANTTTNLLLSDYTITLPKGTNETRFALHVKPSKVVTGLENIGNSVNGLNGETVKKYLIDGVLYLQKGNLLYDAQGRYVQ